MPVKGVGVQVPPPTRGTTQTVGMTVTNSGRQLVGALVKCDYGAPLNASEHRINRLLNVLD